MLFLWLSALDFWPLLGFIVPCGTNVLSDAPSPDGELHAVVYVAGCGAGGSDSYGVSVLWDHEQVERLTRFNTLHTSSESSIEVEWRGSDTLQVTSSDYLLSGPLTHLIVSRIKGVEVVYRDSVISRSLREWSP